MFLISSSIGFSQDLTFTKIGNQIWMQKNFENTRFRNGDVIKEVKSKEEWFKAGYREEPAWCYFDFDPKNARFGKLYNYYAISDSRNIAPPGWRVPSFQDYYTLVNYLDPLCTKEYFASHGSLSGGSLKSKDSRWKNDNCQQINSNFNAIPSGGYSPSLNYPEFDWNKLGEEAMFWCITNWESVIDFFDSRRLEEFKNDIQAGALNDKAIVIKLNASNCEVGGDDDPKLNGYSLRLLKDDK